MKTGPYKSLWDACFWEVFRAMKESGATEIKFDDVDQLALRKSQMEIKDLLKYLGVDGNGVS